jgi:hypothetical protein
MPARSPQCADASDVPAADGALIYKLLGASAESSFTRSWGVSYGLNCAAEWKSVAVAALQGALLLALLECLCWTRNSSWLEARRVVACEATTHAPACA